MATRWKFSQEYKHEAVQLAQSSNQPVSQVARDLGISANLLTRWCREAKDNGPKAFPGIGKPRDEEITTLGAENPRPCAVTTGRNTSVSRFGPGPCSEVSG